MHGPLQDTLQDMDLQPVTKNHTVNRFPGNAGKFTDTQQATVVPQFRRPCVMGVGSGCTQVMLTMGCGGSPLSSSMGFWIGLEVRVPRCGLPCALPGICTAQPGSISQAEAAFTLRAQ